MGFRNYTLGELETSKDGHLTFSTMAFGIFLREREDEPDERSPVARQIREELANYGISPKEISGRPGYRPKKIWW